MRSNNTAPKIEDNRFSRRHFLAAGFFALTGLALDTPADAATIESRSGRTTEIVNPSFEKYINSKSRKETYKNFMQRKVVGINRAVKEGLVVLDRAASTNEGYTTLTFKGQNGIQITVSGKANDKGMIAGIDELTAERLLPGKGLVELGPVKSKISHSASGLVVGEYSSIEQSAPDYRSIRGFDMAEVTKSEHVVESYTAWTAESEAGSASQLMAEPPIESPGSSVAIGFDEANTTYMNKLLADAGLQPQLLI